MSHPQNLVSLDVLVALMRMGFGFIFLIKTFSAIDAKSLVWAHRRPFGIQNDSFFNLLLGLQVLGSFSFMIGFYTGPAAILQWGLYVLLNRAASLYGLEDIVFQLMSFYFVFANAGAALSIDHTLGITIWPGLFPETVLPELFLSLAIAMVFFSAGIGKLRSPMWRSGLGAYYFFLIPQFRRINTAIFTRHRSIITFINHAAIVMQLLCFPAFLLNAIPLGFFCWSFTTSFSFLLSTVFVLTWIGECLFLGLLIVGWVLLDTGALGLGMRLWQEWHQLQNPFSFSLVTLILGTLITALWTIVVPSTPKLTRYPKLAAWHKLMRTVARFSWGIAPSKVFTELHIQGPVVYRVFFDTHTEKDQEIFRIFSPECGPGQERAFRPAFFEVTSYKIAEVCMELDLYGHVATPERRDFVLQLSRYVAQKVRKKTGNTPTCLLYRIIQIIPPPSFAGASDWYRNEKWVDAFHVSFENENPTDITALTQPILKAPSGRDLQRVSFSFNPLSE